MNVNEYCQERPYVVCSKVSSTNTGSVWRDLNVVCSKVSSTNKRLTEISNFCPDGVNSFPGRTLSTTRPEHAKESC